MFFLLEEPLFVLLALIAAIDDLQEKAGQSDEFTVRGWEEALQEAVPGFIEEDEDGQRIIHLENKKHIK